MAVYIMRHGETDWNRSGRLQGQMDIPLNEKGKQQASEMKERIQESGLSFAKVYCSPLSRTRETGRLALGSEEGFRLDERLLEYDYGPFDGTLFEDASKELMAFLMDPERVAPPEGSETIPHLMERVTSFLQDIDQNEDILIITHGVTIRALFGAMLGKEGAYWDLPLDNCCIYTLKDGEVIECVGPKTKEEVLNTL